MYKEGFPSKLKHARIQNGLTQIDVEAAIKIKRMNLSRYETGAREPDIETLGKLSDFYNVSADWLLGSKGK